MKKYTPILFILFILALITTGANIVNAQMITITMAGTGTAGFSGDGGPGRLASINSPTDVCMDAAYNIYFVDGGNSRIRKISAASGAITTIAGGGFSTADGILATTASLPGLSKMGIDAAGNIYVSTSNKIRKINMATGIITTVAGTGAAGYSGDGGLATATELNAPDGVAVDPAGNIYIADVNNNRIRKVTAATGLISTIAGTGVAGSGGDGGLATSATLSSVNSVCVDNSGNVFCANSSSIREIKVTTGIITTINSSGEINGICSDGGGYIYFVQDSCGCISLNVATGATVTIANNGSDGYNGDGGNSTLMELNHPYGVCVDPQGNLYVADEANNRIRKVGLLTTSPSFIYGAVQLITPCPGYPSLLGSPLSVAELNTPITETWTVVMPPTIGTLAGFPATTMSGGTSGLAIPSGTTYTPGAGYTTGSDSFQVQVSNGTTSVIVKIYISINSSSGAGLISGPSAVCHGSGISLTETVPTGTWSATNANATVDPYFGTVSGVTAGVDTVVYTTLFCSMTTTHLVTVNPLPTTAPITGPDTVCVGATVTMTDLIAGGTWTTDWGYATIGAGSGIVTGVSLGSDNISYTVTSAVGCQATVGKGIYVQTNVDPISGANSVCLGASIPLYEDIAGGTWSISNSHTTLTGTGTTVSLTGSSTGVDTVTYINTNMCGTATVTKVITVNPLVAPGTLSGPGSVCVGSDIYLTPSIPGGTWSAVNSSASSFGGGDVYGNTSGIDTILYTGVCASSAVSAVVTVNPLPGGTIAGPSVVCLGSTITLSDVTPGGTWAASNAYATVASTGSASAIVTGVTVGTDVISYTSTNMCGTGTVVSLITVSGMVASSGSISGPAAVCTGATVNFTRTVAGGTWSVSNPDATVSITGVVTGALSGIDTIIYTAACALTSATAAITVNPSPSAGVINGNDTVCTGATTTLTDAVSGGTWTRSSGTVSIGATSGIVTGISYGTSMITYSVSNAWCTSKVTKPITVFSPAVAVSGTNIVCLASTITLSDAIPGGTWSATNGNATIVGATLATITGILSGVDTIMYTNTNSCGTATVTKIVSINPTPNAGTISGPASICTGVATHFTETVSGGTWSLTNANATVGIISNVTGITVGMDTIIYTVTNPCAVVTTTYAVSINPSPVAGTITGSNIICLGSTTTLTDTIVGGTWSSSVPSYASIGSTTGIVTGVSSGNLTISYTVSNAWCTSRATMAMTSGTPIPGNITGSTSVCPETTITIHDFTGGGAWSASNSNATVASSGASAAIVTGISSGIDTILYTATNICGSASATKSVTVNPLPSPGTISGPTTVCAGATITLIPTITGGTWAAYNANATVGLSTGIVTGIAAGSDSIIYTITSIPAAGGCKATTYALVTVGAPSAGAITGPGSVCTGSTISLTDIASGGTWTITNANATVSGSGIVSGVLAGSDSVLYSVTSTCGTATTSTIITIDALPDAGVISGINNLYVGNSTTLSNTATGGTWSSSNTAITTVSGSGLVLGVSAGIDSIIYTATNSCGTANAYFPFTVLSDVTTNINNTGTTGIDKITIIPKPQNPKTPTF